MQESNAGFPTVSSELTPILDKTEQNIRRFEDVFGCFPDIVLNQWRYASRHVASLLDNPQDTVQRQSAIGHIRRAYFDSCDILVVCLLDKIGDLLDTFASVPEVPAKLISGYSEKRALLRRAQKLHREFKSFTPQEKDAQYDKLESVLSGLLAFYDELDAVYSDMLVASERQRREVSGAAVDKIGKWAAIFAGICGAAWAVVQIVVTVVDRMCR